MENIKEVQALFNKVIVYSQNIETPETDDLFDRWLEAKRDFIELFGGKLIYEYPEKVYFEISDSEKESRVKDFARTVENKYGNFALSDFIFSHAKDFFPNRMSEAYHDKVNINGVMKEINIDKGMKMLRAFKYFEEDANVLDAIQQAASMIIQENKIGGTLCLSVHPLDFLSSSENNHNWRSCHALDGEYRAGNLSYMLDKSTVMCYLRSEHMEKLPDFPDDVLWNSKKWRVLLFFSDHWDMLFAGRQYPFSSMTGLDFVKDKFLTTIGFGEFTAWDDKKIRSMKLNDTEIFLRSPHVAVGQKMLPMSELIEDMPGSLHYNDLLHSTCYDPFYAYRVQGSDIFKRIVTSDNARFHIGGRCKCLRCGKDSISMGETMMCTPCEETYGECADDDYYGTCPSCGRRFAWDDGVWVDSAEETICPDCADNYVVSCACCGETMYEDEAVYDRFEEELLCKCCFEDKEDQRRLEGDY